MHIITLIVSRLVAPFILLSNNNISPNKFYFVDELNNQRNANTVVRRIIMNFKNRVFHDARI